MNQEFQTRQLSASRYDGDAEHAPPPRSALEPSRRDVFLSQFLNSLFVRAEMLGRCVHGSDEARILREARLAIDNLRTGEDQPTAYSTNKAWTEAYGIELLLLLAEPKDRLIPELEYRLSRAEATGVEHAADLRKAYERLTRCAERPEAIEIIAFTDDNLEINLRSMLIDTVRRSQWQETKKYLSRVMIKVATRNIVFAALFAFALFISPYVLMFGEYYFSANILDNDVHKWLGFPLFACLTAGLFGSYFSRLLYIQQYSKSISYDELVVTPDIIAILVRGSVGICGAALLYFFLHAGIIKGPFIPDFSKFSMQLIPETKEQYPRLLMINDQLGLLIIWSFLAGFSERLVPSVLATTESKLGNGVKPKT